MGRGITKVKPKQGGKEEKKKRAVVRPRSKTKTPRGEGVGNTWLGPRLMGEWTLGP